MLTSAAKLNGSSNCYMYIATQDFTASFLKLFKTKGAEIYPLSTSVHKLFTINKCIIAQEPLPMRFDSIFPLQSLRNFPGLTSKCFSQQKGSLSL